MNFLAHLYLSGSEPQITIGNFIGDFVKGRNFTGYPPGIQAGIELHRAIDAFTDTHPQVTESKRRLQHRYHHYAGVIVDIFYDHFLASRWRDFHSEPLPLFATRTYELLRSHSDSLPDRVMEMLPYMIRGNWLVNYATLTGIQRALTGLSRRTTYVSHMEESVSALKLFYHRFEREFMAFFPDVRDFSEHWLHTNPLHHE